MEDHDSETPNPKVVYLQPACVCKSDIVLRSLKVPYLPRCLGVKPVVNLTTFLYVFINPVS